MRKAIGYGLIYLILTIGISDFYFRYSPETIIGILSTFGALFLTTAIAIVLIDGGEL